MPWATPEQARQHWPDARSLDDDMLDLLLEASTEQCAEYAPAASQPVSARYVLACIYQAREVYAAGQRGEQDVIGVGDYAIRARPLTAAVKQLLRPQNPRRRFGGRRRS